jgi:hypothetical protein
VSLEYELVQNKQNVRDLQDGIKQAAAVHSVALYESKTKLRSVLHPLFLLPVHLYSYSLNPYPLLHIKEKRPCNRCGQGGSRTS